MGGDRYALLGLPFEARCGRLIVPHDLPHQGWHRPEPTVRKAFGRHFRLCGVWLDSAYQHPMSLESIQAIQDYLACRTNAAFVSHTTREQDRVQSLFARLVNVRPHEVAFVPTATTAENLIVSALGIRAGSRIVTDELHYTGSLYMYHQLRMAGVEVDVVRARQGVVHLEDVQAALARGASLLAVSWVSAWNGHRHDLAALSALAHDHGARVYVDLMQGVGALPIDLDASGVDYAATSSYKWLMADLGLGFLYVRGSALPELTATQFGARQLATSDGASQDWRTRPGTAGKFEVGSVSNIVVASLTSSLEFLTSVDLDAIVAARQPILEHIRSEAAKLGLKQAGFASGGPIVAFHCADCGSVKAALQQSDCYVTCSENRIRFAPTLFNTVDDVDAVMRVLHKTLR